MCSNRYGACECSTRHPPTDQVTHKAPGRSVGGPLVVLMASRVSPFCGGVPEALNTKLRFNLISSNFEKVKIQNRRREADVPIAFRISCAKKIVDFIPDATSGSFSGPKSWRSPPPPPHLLITRFGQRLTHPSPSLVCPGSDTNPPLPQTLFLKALPPSPPFLCLCRHEVRDLRGVLRA